MSQVLLGIAAKQGLLLAVEDLHAADPDTLYFLNYLLAKAAAAKLFGVVTLQEEQLSVQQMAETLEQWRKLGHRMLGSRVDPDLQSRRRRGRIRVDSRS